MNNNPTRSLINCNYHSEYQRNSDLIPFSKFLQWDPEYGPFSCRLGYVADSQPATLHPHHQTVLVHQCGQFQKGQLT